MTTLELGRAYSYKHQCSYPQNTSYTCLRLSNQFWLLVKYIMIQTVELMTHPHDIHKVAEPQDAKGFCNKNTSIKRCLGAEFLNFRVPQGGSVVTFRSLPSVLHSPWHCSGDVSSFHYKRTCKLSIKITCCSI